MRLRDLSISKRYRDTVKKWGEPKVTRKRTIFAPPMCEAKEMDVNIRPRSECGHSRNETWSTNAPSQIESLFEGLGIDKHIAQKAGADLSKDYIDYQTWIERERKVRRDLNNIGFNDKWLMGKKDHTVMEKRVFENLKCKSHTHSDDDDVDGSGVQDSEPNVIQTPPKLTKSQMRLLPLLQQPMPVALSIIAEYCYENKLRLLDLYAQIDKDKNWLISRDEVRKIVHRNKIPLTEAQLEDMIIALDVDNNDQLDYRELAQGVEAYRVDDRWQKIRKLMKLMEAYEESKTKNQGRVSSSFETSEQSRKAVKIKSAPHKSGRDDLKDSDNDSFEGHLQLPNINDDDKADSLASMDRERRMRKHKERKRRKQKEMQVKSKGVLPSTMGGITGQMKDRYAETVVSHAKKSLDLMHANGIPVREDAVKRVMLFPFDKPIEDCKVILRQPGVDLVMGSQFGKTFGNKTERKAESCRKKKRKLTPHGRQRRSQSPFWPDTTYSQLSLEQFGRRTPQESIFTVTRR